MTLKIEWVQWCHDGQGEDPMAPDARGFVYGASGHRGVGPGLEDLILDAYEDGSYGLESRSRSLDEIYDAGPGGADLTAAKQAATRRAEEILAGAYLPTPKYEFVAAAAAVAESIPMLLWCPACGTRHVDIGVFATRVHHTHACQNCGVVWRPALVPTVGVLHLPGFKGDGAAEAESPEEQCDELDSTRDNRCLLRRHAFGAHVYGTPDYDPSRAK